MGTLSKLYKELKPQMAEKAAVAKAMGLNLHNELSSWLESISYVRNIIAHHSRLWNRPMLKTPISQLINPQYPWLNQPLQPVQKNRPFLIISTMIYLCNKVAPGNQIKTKLIGLFQNSPNIPLDKIGFINDWENNPLWKY